MYDRLFTNFRWQKMQPYTMFVLQGVSTEPWHDHCRFVWVFQTTGSSDYNVFRSFLFKLSWDQVSIDWLKPVSVWKGPLSQASPVPSLPHDCLHVDWLSASWKKNNIYNQKIQLCCKDTCRGIQEHAALVHFISNIKWKNILDNERQITN